MLSYPSTSYTNPNLLYSSLGTFWTRVFQEKKTVQGYCQGLSEELIQIYRSIFDTINENSTWNVPVFAKEKWYPLTIKKSEFDLVPLQFSPNVVFGPQPNTDIVYPGQTFEFGRPKATSGGISTVNLPTELANFPILADRVIDPSVIYIRGVDLEIDGNVALFNSNIFENPDLIVTPLYNEDGSSATYLDISGNTQPDSYIVLWAYNADVDNKTLRNGFGNIFNVAGASSDMYKSMLRALFTLHVTGPTVGSLRGLVSSFLNIPIAHTNETATQVYYTSLNGVVETDKNTYNLPIGYGISVNVGDSLAYGDTLTDVVKYVDSVAQNSWWSTLPSLVGFSNKLFIGNYASQLFFPNELEIVTMSSAGSIVFPVDGTPSDVAAFQTAINIPEIWQLLGLEINGVKQLGKSTVINPVDFVMSNYFRNNMACIYLNLDTSALPESFFENMKTLSSFLPKHIFLMLNMSVAMPQDSYANLNNSINITFTAGSVTLNADGSDSNGEIQSLDPYYYVDVKDRLFALGKSPAFPTSLVSLNSSSGGDCNIQAGQLTTSIPANASTAIVGTINLLTFS